VWEVIARLQELEGSEEHRISLLSAQSDLHPPLIRMALDYAAERVNEVRELIDRNRAMAERSRATARQRESLLAWSFLLRGGGPGAGGARPGPRCAEAGMTAASSGSSQQAVVEAALVLLERMGLSPADLAAVPQSRKPVPTFAEYVPVVSAVITIMALELRAPAGAT
jgi:hypothetical protein